MLDTIATENPHPALLQVETPRSGPALRQQNRYALLRLETESVVVTDTTGASPVSVADLLTALPDPFCEIESTLLWHLATVHGDVVARLVSRLPAQWRRGPIRPSASTGTVCNFGSRTTTATVTSGCRSIARWTT
ncbi:hypothetical protein I547_2773 [Mycobacterium kansasii 824]|nr:hypothetical protein I547_2773 [Mycobacterium kansasii 824]